MAIPVAVQGHDHACPMYSGKKAHKGGAITEGDNALTINGVPVALVGHQCSCQVGGPDIIISGTAAITVNGVDVALQGSKTAHGGVVVEGDSAMTVG